MADIEQRELLAQVIADMALATPRADGLVSQVLVFEWREKLVAALASQAQVPEDVRRDAERLDWLEGFVRKAYFYGGSFDFARSSEGERGGYRLMSRGRLGQRHSTIRQAIDAAMAAAPAPEVSR